MPTRKHLYKAKRKDNGEWVKGDLVTYKNGDCYIFVEELTGALHGYFVDPETVCECTGLTDKNGDEIFEGDILQAGNYRFVVKFGKCGGIKNVDHEVGYIGFYVIPVGKDAEIFIKIGYRRDILYWLNAYDASIIGNIYDNPELVEVKA